VRPPEDREESAEATREIEERGGVYVLSEEEKAAINVARRCGIASDYDVTAFWKRLGIA
jgi:hypothetical protein